MSRRVKTCLRSDNREPASFPTARRRRDLPNLVSAFICSPLLRRLLEKQWRGVGWLRGSLPLVLHLWHIRSSDSHEQRRCLSQQSVPSSQHSASCWPLNCPFTAPPPQHREWSLHQKPPPPHPPFGEVTQAFRVKQELTANGGGRSWPQTMLSAIAVVVYLFHFKTIADMAGLNYFSLVTCCAEKWPG